LAASKGNSLEVSANAFDPRFKVTEVAAVADFMAAIILDMSEIPHYLKFMCIVVTLVHPAKGSPNLVKSRDDTLETVRIKVVKVALEY